MTKARSPNQKIIEANKRDRKLHAIFGLEAATKVLEMADNEFNRQRHQDASRDLLTLLICELLDDDGR